MGSRRCSCADVFAAAARKSKGDAKDGPSGKEKQFFNYYHSTYSIRQYLTDQYGLCRVSIPHLKAAWALAPNCANIGCLYRACLTCHIGTVRAQWFASRLTQHACRSLSDQQVDDLEEMAKCIYEAQLVCHTAVVHVKS